MRKIFVLLLVLTFLLQLVACERNSDESSSVVWGNEDVQNENITYRITNNIKISLRACSFNDGVAWCSFYNEESCTDCVGLIDTHGQMLYILDSKKYPADSKSINITPLPNGFSLVEDDMIIDKHGNTVYVFSDDSIRIIGYHESGNIFLSKHTEDSFATDSNDYLYILGPDLNLIETNIKITTSIDRDDQISRLSDNLYYFKKYGNGGVYINLENDSFIDAGPNNMNLMYYDNNNAVVEQRGRYYLLPINNIKSATDYSELLSLLDADDSIYLAINDASGITGGLLAAHLNDEYDKSIFYVGDWSYSGFKGGSFYREVRSYSAYSVSNTPYYEYIDLIGNTIVRYPSFPNNVKYCSIEGFSNGYSALYLQGADEEKYNSIIDTDGNLIYDPVKFIGYGSCNGCIFGYSDKNSAVGILSPTGEFVKFGSNLPWFDYDTCYNMNSNGCVISINEGFMLYIPPNNNTATYYRIDGTGLIDHAYAKIDKEGYLLIEDEKGNIKRGVQI